jgi:hypothetical protein
MISGNGVQSHGGYDSGNDNEGEGNVYPYVGEWPNVSAQVAEMSASLAAAKPESTKDNIWSEVSFFFTSPEIILYTNGFGNSQVAPSLRARGAAITALGTPRRGPGASNRYAKR